MLVSGRYFTNEDGDRFEYEIDEEGDAVFRITTAVNDEEVTLVNEDIDKLIKFLQSIPTADQPENSR